MIPSADAAAPDLRAALLYFEINQFYASQMRMLDRGDAEGFARTFTGAGEFFHSTGVPPLRGRDQISAAITERQSAQDGQRRHWFGMLEATEGADGEILAQFYALVVLSLEGQSTPVLVSSNNATDVLERGSDGLLVSRRDVSSDR